MEIIPESARSLLNTRARINIHAHTHTMQDNFNFNPFAGFYLAASFSLHSQRVLEHNGNSGRCSPYPFIKLKSPSRWLFNLREIFLAGALRSGEFLTINCFRRWGLFQFRVKGLRVRRDMCVSKPV